MITYNYVQDYKILKIHDNIIEEIEAHINETYNPIISIDPVFYCYMVNDIMLTRENIYKMNDRELRDMICHLNTGIQTKLYTEKEELEKIMKKLLYDKDQIFQLLCSDYVYKNGRLNDSMKDDLYRNVCDIINQNQYNIRYDELMVCIQEKIQLVNLLQKKNIVWTYLTKNKYIQYDHSKVVHQ